MNLIALFIAQRSVFEEAYSSGEWTRLGEYFHEDISYEVMNMSFHCSVKGREAVLAGLERSVERFDKRCMRTVGIDSFIREEGANVLVSAGISFEREGAPSMSARLWEIATYKDGLIERIIDIYDPSACKEFERWMEQWGSGLDPSYVV